MAKGGMKEEWGKSASRRGAWENTVRDTRGYLDQTVISELKVIVRGVTGHWALLSHRKRTRPLLRLIGRQEIKRVNLTVQTRQGYKVNHYAEQDNRTVKE